MSVIFVNNIVKVNSYYNAVDKLYKVMEETSYKWFFKKVKTTVIIFSYVFLTKKWKIEDFNVENKYYDEENRVVRHKPHCDIFLSDGNVETKYFNTSEELTEFVNKLINLNPNIEI